MIEAGEDAGFTRADLLSGLGFSEAAVMSREAKVEWTTVVRLVERIADLVGHDVDRLRDIGARMTTAPSYAPLRRLAGAIVSPRLLYEIGNRVVAPTNFPHLRLTGRFTSARRMELYGVIPARYEPSAAFFHVFEGSVVRLPTLLGLPPAKLVRSTVTPRTCDVVVELPRAHSVAQRVRRSARAIFHAGSALAILHEHRRELASSVEALERARDELRAVLEQLPDPVLVHSGGSILWANQAFSAMTGYDVEELVGRQLLDHVAEPSRAVVATRMRLPPGAPGRHTLTQVSLLTRTGEERVVEVAPTQGVVWSGTDARLIVARDITERVRMQQKLILADRLASIGLLAAGVAHEVNNPLAYVLNNIEIARKALAPLGPEADVSRQVLAVALEGVDRIRTIVRDLLKLSRGDHAPTVEIDVAAVVESTLALAGREIEAVTELVVDVEPAPLVDASDARLAQVLLNLVVNALEAMRSRPREHNRLRIRVATAADGRALLEVNDNGPGIAATDLPRLFEPFFTTKAGGSGTGLGLAIAQQLVVELKGEIAVRSTPGEGSTFSVLLPAATSTSDRPASVAGAPRRVGAAPESGERPAPR